MSKLFNALIATTLFFSGCASTQRTIPELNLPEHYWTKGREYHVAYKIPSTNFYIHEYSKNGQVEAVEKAERKIKEIQKNPTNYDLEKIDDGDKIITPKEFNSLIENN